ncbi:MAG: hypothetical protein ACFFBD_03410 [Candidatus Hodarchaeota archaeon]
MLDDQHILKDARAVTSSGYGEVDSTAKVVNLGSGLVRGNVIIDVTAMALTDNDELYQLHLMGGDDSSFTKEVALATAEIGCKEVTEETHDSKMGRYILPFENEKNGVVYPYVRIRHAISGTTPSINYTCRLEKDLPVRGTVSATATTTTT